MNIQHILGKPHSFIHFSFIHSPFIHSLTAVFQFKVVHIMIYLYNHENYVKKHVHNEKMLMNIKRKGWDTRFCVCKSKIKSYVILPCLTCTEEREIHQNTNNGICLGVVTL